jgi:LemA protein
MSSTQITFLLVVAILTFWSVGAYNRLVRLRGDILLRFEAVDRQLEARSSLLQRQIDLLAALADSPPRDLDALRAARTQADAAWTAAQREPAAEGAINSLRVALQILEQVRVRLPAPVAASAEMAELHVQLAACDNALQYAQRQFNDAVHEYNVAVRQFPTWLLAAMMRFRSAMLL